MQIRTIDSSDPFNSLAKLISFLDKVEGKKIYPRWILKQVCQTETDPGVILICKLQDICSTERQKDKICLKSHVSNGQPLKSPASENRLYFIDHKSKQCVLSCSYLGSKILWDGKFLSFPCCKYTIFNGPVLYWKRVLSIDLVKLSHCASKCSGHIFWPLPSELGAGWRQERRFLQTKWKFPKCSVW